MKTKTTYGWALYNFGTWLAIYPMKRIAVQAAIERNNDTGRSMNWKEVYQIEKVEVTEYR